MEVKWIKIATGIFDDEKIQLIEAMPEADSIIVIWFKLLCLAGKNNNNGVFMLNDRIAYTDEMLATIFRRPITIVRLALNTFENFGMIEIIEGVVTIPNWEFHQNIEGLDKIREQNRLRKQNQRQREKLLLEDNMSRDSIVTVTQENKNKELDIDNLVESKDSTRRTQDVQRIINAWNEIGLQQVTKVTSDSIRGKMLNARLKEYGVDEVLKVINKVKQSDFLKGQGSKSWVADFEWVVKPNNFVKILEGNYDNRTQQQSSFKVY